MLSNIFQDFLSEKRSKIPKTLSHGIFPIPCIEKNDRIVGNCDYWLLHFDHISSANILLVIYIYFWGFLSQLLSFEVFLISTGFNSEVTKIVKKYAINKGLCKKELQYFFEICVTYLLLQNYCNSAILFAYCSIEIEYCNSAIFWYYCYRFVQ